MNYKKIFIRDISSLKESQAYFEFVGPVFMDGDNSPLPLIIVVPGGAYGMCSNREADPIALKFLVNKYAVAILRYTCVDEKNREVLFPQPQLELLATFNFLVKNHDNLNVDKAKISVVGFSAGGHLVASYGYLYKNSLLTSKLNIENPLLLKPYSLCLCYPVVSTIGPETHLFTRNNLIGNDLSLLNITDVIKNVSSDYPQSFIWTTKDDNVVDYQNSVFLADALNKSGVRNMLTIYPHGVHGLSTADFLTNCPENCDDKISRWVDEYLNFIK